MFHANYLEWKQTETCHDFLLGTKLLKAFDEIVK